MSYDRNQEFLGYTGNTKERCPRLIWRIENFTLNTNPGQWTTSPVIESPQSHQRWCLNIRAWEASDRYQTRNGQRIIKIYLKRLDDYVSKQLVEVKLSIVSRFGVLVKNINMWKRPLLFDNLLDYAVLFAETEDYFTGIKGFLYLPNDTLTLQCSMVIRTECTTAAGQFEDDHRQSIELVEQNRLSWSSLCFYGVIIIFILVIIDFLRGNSH